jgi:diguanylate cyclase (GGDEF)-like protein/PAS domain S-box-containing protein
MAPAPMGTAEGARALLHPGGALAQYPDAAFMLSDAGMLLAGNPAGLDLAARIGISPATAQSLPFTPGEPGRVTVSVATVNGTSIVEITTLPQPDGRTTLVLGRDQTADHALRAALAESRLRFKDLVEVSSDFMWETGADGAFVYVSPAGAFGYTAEALLARRPDTFIATLAPDRNGSPFATREPRSNVELWFRCADGRLARLATAAVPLWRNGVWGGARGLCRDITALHEHETQLARMQVREQLVAYILRALHDEDDHHRLLSGAAAAVARGFGADGCSIFQRDGDVNSLAATFGAVAGLTDDVIQRLTLEAQPTEGNNDSGHWMAMVTRSRRGSNGALVVFRRTGQPAWAEDERQLLVQVARQVGIAMADAEHQRLLEHQSRHDVLTGLINRRYFTERAGERIAAARAASRPIALAFIDLDNFKSLNDRAGHERGDDVLIHVGRMLERGLAPDNFAARLGGDEFAVWLDGSDADAATRWARDLMAESASLAALTPDGCAPLGMSVGIAVCPAGMTLDLPQMTAHADAAMYHVKQRGKSNVHVVSIDGNDAATEPGAKP